MAVLALDARGVAKVFGAVTALADVSLTVAHGECVALVGESGSGKSTLLRVFNALTRMDAGQAQVDGVDVATTDPVALRRAVARALSCRHTSCASSAWTMRPSA